MYYCYILYSENPLYMNRTYVGSTNNLKKRIRQHNCEIKGGAKSTCITKPNNYLCVIQDFYTLPVDNCNHDKHSILSFEWHLKHVVNKGKLFYYLNKLTKKNTIATEKKTISTEKNTIEPVNKLYCLTQKQNFSGKLGRLNSVVYNSLYNYNHLTITVHVKSEFFDAITELIAKNNVVNVKTIVFDNKICS